MRFYFRFDLEFTYHGHAFAVWLKRDRGLTDDSFRGMVGGRLYHHFLTRVQRDIRYPHLSTYQDLMWRARTEPPDRAFLRTMERKLNIDTLWRLFSADRSIQGFSYEQALSAISIFLSYFTKEFETFRPEAVISFTSSNLSGLAAYFVARHLGIPYVEFATTRLYKRALVNNNPFIEFAAVEERYRDESLTGRIDERHLREAEHYIRDFRAAPLLPDGVERARQIHSKQTSLHPRRLLGFLRVNYWWYFSHYRRDIATEPPLNQAANTVRMGLRRRRLAVGDVFERELPPGERYVYFALHFQPEMTTMVLAPFWQDQLALVENVARSLPVDLRLYVKEHVPMLGLRPPGYYDRLRRVPNVRLVEPYASSLELTRNAEVVVTINGTVGFEALLLGRPVVTFGRIFYNALDCVQKCRAIEDLPAIIKRCIEDSPHDERQLRAYVAALLAESFPFDAEQLWDPRRAYESVRDAESTRALYDGYMRALARERAGSNAEGTRAESAATS